MTSHPSSVHYYDFPDVTVSLGEAIRTIRAALEDEGLTLSPNDNTTHSRITSVLVDGVKRVIVPDGRIIPAESRPRLEVDPRWAD